MDSRMRGNDGIVRGNDEIVGGNDTDQAISSDGKKIIMMGRYERQSQKNTGEFAYKNRNVLCKGIFEIKNQ